MKKVFNFGIMVIISLVFIFMTSLQGYAAKTNLILDGKVSITDSVGNGSGDDNEYKATVTTTFLSTSPKSNTITLTNETDKDVSITFGYSASNYTVFTINEKTVSANGNFSSDALAPKDSIEIVITAQGSRLSTATATLTLTEITCTTLLSSSEVTILFDSTLGTVTADGATIVSGDPVVVGEAGVQMIATPTSDAVFLGWIEGENLISSRDKAYTQMPVGNKTIKALFAKKGIPYFLVGNTVFDNKIVGDTYVYSDWDEAFANGNYVCLMCDAVLPAGDYTIPAGKTLLIPFDDANTLYTNKPVGVEVKSGTYKIPTVYRTLTMASGANIIVNGAISVSAKHSASQGTTAAPIGTYGHIAMEEGSTITVNNGANLYAWGYITGSGTITAESGATVYECFQLMDYRGGQATLDMKDNEQGVFPMSQYYVQNIEVPLALKAGAIENGFMSIFISGKDIVSDMIESTEVPFIGDKGMFNIIDGFIIKDYDEKTDRLVIDTKGAITMQALSITMKVTLINSVTINSEVYTLPINGNITLNVNKNSVINVSQDIALLPGGEINVYKDATCTFSEGAKAFIYSEKEWGNYCAHTNKKFLEVKYAPGRKHIRTEDDLKDAKVYIEGEVDASNGFVYTTVSGADVQGAEGGLVKIKPGSEENTYQVTQNDTDISAYNPIPVTTALLKNDDGTYTNPEEDISCLSSYSYLNGKWVPNHNFSEEWTIDVEPTCTTSGSKSHHCMNCTDVKTDTTEIDALGHDIVTHKAQAPTCEVIGWNEYETCSRCDYTTYVEKSALGHDITTHEAKAPTCDAIGWDAYETCSRCDYSTYAEKTTLGHSYGEKWIEDDEINHKKVCTNDESHVIREEHTFDNFICTACGYSVPSIGETSGWESIKETISATQEEKVTVEMNETVKVPAEVFETIAGTDTTVEFKVNDEISWTVKGEEVSEEVDLGEINLNVELSTDITGIPEAEIKKVEAEEEIQLELAHDGEFGFTMYLSVEFGADKAGKWANLYYFNTETQSLEFQESVIIDKNGVAEFSFSHASSYLATISGESATLKEKATTTTYSIADEKITISTALNFDVSYDAQIMIATYTENGSLLDISVKTPSTLEAVTFSSKNVAEIKVFVWDGFDTMKPVSLPEQVPVTASSN